VLRPIAAGKSNREIAGQLFVTVDTVKKHITHIFRKLGVHSRTQAVARARELGLIP
jgi:LuxR family maltose regulon positive regulatory protein